MTFVDCPSWETIVAHHEAAHAVAVVLFGDRCSLHRITTVPDAEGSGRVDWRPPTWGTPLVNARATMLISLVGPACSHRLRRDESESWIHPDACWWDGDAAMAMTAAEAFAGDRSRRARQMFMSVCSWADELLTISQVWSSIQRLAGQLPSGTTLDGPDAARAVMNAWGDWPTLAQLDRKWARRFA